MRDTTQPAPTPRAPKVSFAARLFGHDVFVSFALGGPPRGSQSYASDLARRLRERDLSVFFSEDEAPPGSPLADTLTRALQRARVLVVIVNRGTLEVPRWVRTEVEAFRAGHPGRPVIPVCLDDSLRDAAVSAAVQSWLQHGANIWLNEQPDAAARGLATDALIARLVTAPRRLRANALWRALVASVGLLLAALAASAAWQAAVAVRERELALSRQLAVQSAAAIVSEPVVALLLAAQAHAVKPTAASDSALLGALDALPLARQQQHDAAFNTLAIAPGSDRILVSDMRNAVLQGEVGRFGFEVLEPAPKSWSLFQSVKAFAFAPDGQTWASAGSSREITVRSGSSVQRLEDGGKIGESTPIYVLGLAFSPDGRSLVSAASDGPLLLHDLANGGSRPLGAGSSQLASVVFAPDGRWVAVGGDSGFLQAVPVDVAASAPKLGGSRSGTVHSLAVDTAGRHLFAASVGGRIEVFRIDDGRRLAWEDALEHGALLTMAVSPDGGFIASGHGTGAVVLWQWRESGEWPRRVLLRHAAEVRGLAFAADGRTLVSAGADGRLFVTLPVDRGRWQPRPGPVQAKVSPPFLAAAEVRSPDGHWIAWAGTAAEKTSPFELDLGGLSLTRMPRLTVVRGADRQPVADGVELRARPGERITGDPVFAAGVAPLAVPVGNRLLFWDLQTVQPLDAALALPSGTRLAGTSADGTAWLVAADTAPNRQFAFPTDRGAWLGMACALAGRALTAQEWRRYLGDDRSYAPACR